MTLERAHEIKGALVGISMVSMGLEEKCPDLSGYTLAEMVEAGKVIESAEKDGTPITVICDDRQVAAIYALVHHDAEPRIAPKAILVADGKALVCVEVPRG